ncbi:tRNA (adenosine(37)-N6)-threonylcarbamoyltransferase complex dimerization subunit type 1 TsaB [Myroides guanonis]|uniref:tRNA threonylcarbamoyladenosine biosynthesis protein TsaB n=1 Tax=Myroides guanonis TaxID=1150112 RepID=A0A1I3QDI2_9FLAO|nr:tRNA (adenosine(37)-N6)-threonylcarbamoyltransferase complex dimerization subunit type 1 TsaB [Myroides guanonis]SFJ31785.1 tRNA threonylcarbamoyladenosine biosynthesis protein TsaB [Myroides guanonis]
MALILSVETATKNCSVSLSKDGKLLDYKELAEANFTHAEKLHLFIEDLLKENGYNLPDLKAIAVSQGPGSYTGLRIGVSSVKGLCYALEIPMIAIDTLEVLARQLVIEEGLIVPMIDARRMEVYSAVFSKEYNMLEGVQALVVENDSYERFKGQTLHLLGDGASKCKELLDSSDFVYHELFLYPSAKEMVVPAYKKFLVNEFVDVAYFEPFYLKDFVMATKKK